jgi:YggT family protein
MRNALTFITSAILDLYVATFFLRLALGWVRGDFRNPLAQFIVKVTNPLVLPARRFIPSLGGLDVATLVVLVLVQSLATAVLVQLACAGGAEVGQIVAFGMLRLIHLILRIYSLLLIIYVISSWFAPSGYNPALALLGALVGPVLAPFRRVIPLIGGIDVSPIAVFLLIEFLHRLIPSGPMRVGLVCVPF